MTLVYVNRWRNWESGYVIVIIGHLFFIWLLLYDFLSYGKSKKNCTNQTRSQAVHLWQILAGWKMHLSYLWKKWLQIGAKIIHPLRIYWHVIVSQKLMEKKSFYLEIIPFSPTFFSRNMFITTSLVCLTRPILRDLLPDPSKRIILIIKRIRPQMIDHFTLSQWNELSWQELKSWINELGVGRQPNHFQEWWK